MTETTTPRKISTKDTAKLVRAALKKTFPGFKFSVRSKSYSGGSSISVDWTDGPTLAEVQKVAQRFEGADFDGMIDLKTHHNSILVHDDGSTEIVSYGADYVLCHRSISKERRREILESLREFVLSIGIPGFVWSDVHDQSLPVAVARKKDTSDGETHWAECSFAQSWTSTLVGQFHGDTSYPAE